MEDKMYEMRQKGEKEQLENNRTTKNETNTSMAFKPETIKDAFKEEVQVIHQAVDNYELTFSNTWTIPLKKIDKNEHGQKALDILNVMAYLSPENISENIFKNGSNIEEINSSIKLLTDFSIIEKDTCNLKIHPQVQNVIRFQIKEQKKEKTILKKALQLMKCQTKTSGSDNIIHQHLLSIWDYANQYPELIEEFQKFPLHYASQKGLLTSVKYLIDDYPNINKSDSYGKTALFRAAQGEHWEVVEYLIKEMNNKHFDGSKYMLSALGQENKDIIKYLVQIVTDRSCDYNGVTFLYKAAQDGNLQVVKHLVDEGVNVLASNTGSSEMTLLHAAVYSDNEDVIRHILTKIKDRLGGGNRKIMDDYINAKDRKGDTALMWAAEGGRNIATKTMLNDYVDNIKIDEVNKMGETALHWAANKKVLDDKEAVNWKKRVTQEDWLNNDAMKKLEVEDAMKWAEKKLMIAKLLIEFQTNVTIKDSSGKTALDVAEEEGCLDIIQLLKSFHEVVDPLKKSYSIQIETKCT